MLILISQVDIVAKIVENILEKGTSPLSSIMSRQVHKEVLCFGFQVSFISKNYFLISFSNQHKADI